MSFDPQKITFFAKTDARGANVPFGIKAIDRTKHMYVIGKTGMGKSTLLENMAVQDIANGEGMAFIDPHGQTAETLLDYIPEERKDDVLYFAPFDTEHPVAFNVMEDVGPERRHLVTSGLMSVFKKIFVDAWSARMEYILTNTLLALLEYPDSTLLGVNRMLSEKHYRKKVIDNISDPAVKAFWVDEFLNYNERYMQEAGDSIKNKIGQFTANPLIRNIIGQPKSSFDIRKMMDEKKIIIMNLSKGLVGESNANLLGSMLTTRIYLAAMSRADVSVVDMKEMPNFYFYVDEFQSFANATFADILSEARKYKLNLTIAHQYIEQMEEEVRNAVFGNVGTIAAFRVGPFDAEVLETIFNPQFYAVDICNLGFAQIYLTLMIDGIGSKPFSASTLPPIEPKAESCKQMVIHRSREQFSRPRAAVEQEITEWMLPMEQSGNGNGGGGGKSNGPSGAPRRSGGGGNAGGNNGGGGGREGNGRPPRRDAVAGGNGDRPRSGGGNGGDGERSEKPKNDKSLDELRSVLQGLAKPKDKSEASEAKPKAEPAPKVESTTEEKVVSKTEITSNQKVEVEKPKAPKPVLNQSTAEKPRPASSKPKSERRTETRQSDVKKALADVLGDITKKTEPKKEITERAAPAEPKSKPVPEIKEEEVKTPATPVVDQVVSEPKVQSAPERTAPQAEAAAADQAAYSAAKNRDPFDPKQLERMMRVTTADKSPLK